VKTILSHRNDPIPKLPDTYDPLQSGAQQIFEKMVAKRPEDRYQDIEDLIGDLDRIDELEIQVDNEESKVTRLEDKDVVELGEPPTYQPKPEPNPAPKRSTATAIPTTAMAIRIEDDGSITNLPSSDNVIDLTGNDMAHIAPVSSATVAQSVNTTPSQDNLFRIEADIPSRGLPLIVGAVIALILTISTYGIVGIIAGPIVWWIARRHQKEMKVGDRSVDKLPLTRIAKYGGIAVLVLGILKLVEVLS